MLWLRILFALTLIAAVFSSAGSNEAWSQGTLIASGALFAVLIAFRVRERVKSPKKPEFT